MADSVSAGDIFSNYSEPAHSHADAMQIFRFCMADFSILRLCCDFLGLVARPERFELPTPKFVENPCWRTCRVHRRSRARGTYGLTLDVLADSIVLSAAG